MMYIHYCANCRHIHMLNGHKTLCPACTKMLQELEISYLEYVNLPSEERKKLLEKLTNSVPKNFVDFR